MFGLLEDDGHWLNVGVTCVVLFGAWLLLTPVVLGLQVWQAWRWCCRWAKR